MTDQLVEVRRSTVGDAAALSALSREAWRNAYRGIIPGLGLERMLGRRGPAWWRDLHRCGGVLVIDVAGAPAGYAMLGAARSRMAGTGEIYELYLRPDCQGVGLGRRLFETSRRHLRDRGRPRLVVWALAENASACRFYRAMDGREFGRSSEAIGGARLEKVGFAWG